MIINYKGLVEREIGGRTVFFKFNMAAITLLNKIQGVGFKEFSEQLQDPRFDTFANFLYAGAETAFVSEGKNADKEGKRTFSFDDATEWLNELGIMGAGELYIQAFEVPETKNDNPPSSTEAESSKTS